MSDHLIRKGAIYYYRRRVPADLLAAYGKPEYTKSLRTKDKREAERLQRITDVEVDALFQQCRERIKRLDNTPNAQQVTYTTPQYDPLSGEMVSVRIPTQADIDAQEQFQEEALREQFLDTEKDEAEAAAREQYLTDMEEVFRRIAAKEAIAQRTAAPPVTAHRTQPAKAVQRPAAAPPRRVLTPTDGLSLHAILRLWAKEQTPKQRTVDTAERAANRFREAMGDIAVPSVTKLQIVEFRNKLLAANHSPNTINKTLNYMSILFNHAVKHAWITVDPAQGTRLTIKPDSTVKRVPFTETVLNGIFAHPIYTEKHREPSGAGEAAYWLPLLALYTGARIEELCQLAPSDIKQEKYRDKKENEQIAWVMHITDTGEGQGVKNMGSKRRIPIHAEILNRGFIEYVESQKTQRRIFPLLKPNKYGDESPNWSVWWMKQMRRAEIIPPGRDMVFHSFRHNYKDACRDCGIRKEVADALQGHSEGDSSGDYGGEFYPLRPMVEAVRKYRVAGVKLPAIPISM